MREGGRKKRETTQFVKREGEKKTGGSEKRRRKKLSLESSPSIKAEDEGKKRKEDRTFYPFFSLLHSVLFSPFVGDLGGPEKRERK